MAFREHIFFLRNQLSGAYTELFSIGPEMVQNHLAQLRAAQMARFPMTVSPGLLTARRRIAALPFIIKAIFMSLPTEKAAL